MFPSIYMFKKGRERGDEKRRQEKGGVKLKVGNQEGNKNVRNENVDTCRGFYVWKEDDG